MRNVIQCALEQLDKVGWVQSEFRSRYWSEVQVGETIVGVEACILEGIALTQFYKLGIDTRRDGVDSLTDCARRLLGMRNTALMECAFEPFLPEVYGAQDDPEFARAYEFCKGVADPRERAKRILTNSLLNNGRFKP